MTIFDKFCAKLIFRKDGSITWFGVICLIGTIFFLSAVLSLFTGCVNVFTARNPLSDTKVEECYQSTKLAMTASWVVAFPQSMSSCPSDYCFQPENILLIPLGLVVFSDGVVEFAGDTLFLPYDWPVSANRQRKREEERRRRAEEWRKQREAELRVKAASVAEHGGLQ